MLAASRRKDRGGSEQRRIGRRDDAKIRKAIADDSTLSTYAHNMKIITTKV
jgi:hypothetical protein